MLCIIQKIRFNLRSNTNKKTELTLNQYDGRNYLSAIYSQAGIVLNLLLIFDNFERRWTYILKVLIFASKNFCENLFSREFVFAIWTTFAKFAKISYGENFRKFSKNLKFAKFAKKSSREIFEICIFTKFAFSRNLRKIGSSRNSRK